MKLWASFGVYHNLSPGYSFAFPQLPNNSQNYTNSPNPLTPTNAF